MLSAECESILFELFQTHSFRLEKISQSTYPNDIILKIKDMSAAEADSIATMIKGGICYRCRIGQRRFFFAGTPEDAVRLALADQKRPKGTK